VDWIRRALNGGALDEPSGKPPRDHPLVDPPAGEPPAAALPYRRAAYLPVVEGGPFGAGSGFGGVPHLADGIDHPACPRCQRPMPLIAQVDLGAQPVPVIAGEGLLQLFYCVREVDGEACDVVLEGWAPFSKAHAVRLVATGHGHSRASAHTEALFHPVRITGWTPVYDYPGWEELGTLGADAGEPSDDVEPYPVTGEKLGGWPRWIQGVEYPSCPACSSTMGLVLQVDSRRNLAHDWGDMGRGHVTQCPKHAEVLAFAWACA
jgi:hypothetical protein